MDPALWELLEGGDPQDEVSVIVRVVNDADPPPAVRVVSRFGDVATGRMQRGDIVATRAHPSVISLKASELVTAPSPFESGEMTDELQELDGSDGEDAAIAEATPVTPVSVGEDGRGVVVGICDWGF